MPTKVGAVNDQGQDATDEGIVHGNSAEVKA